MDSLLVYLFKKTFALQFYPHFGFVTGYALDVADWYGGSATLVLSLGYILIMILCIPMGMVNLDENVKFQWIR